MSLDLLIKALENTGDGAFVTNECQTITYWNRAAEELLDQPPFRTKGQPCYLIMRGLDDQGDLVCHKNCRLARKAVQGSPVENFDLKVRGKGGRDQWINISLFTFPSGNNGKFIVHLFRDADQKKRNEQLVDQLTDLAGKWKLEETVLGQHASSDGHRVKSLTERESEVLLLLSRGGSTQDISEALSISANTTRNHVQNILKKLGVHSRLEAVAYASQQGLIEDS